MSGVVKLARPSVNFEQIPRSLIQHPSLSLEAKWLPIWLAAKPPSWTIRSDALMNELKWTKEKYYKAVKLLAANGYWTHQKIQGAGGHFLHFYEVRLEPIEAEKPCAGFPEAGEPESGKPAPIDNKRTSHIIEKISDNKNPAALPPKPTTATPQAAGIEISFEILKKGLLTKGEATRLQLLSNKEKNGQQMIDELCEQLTLQGRHPKGSITDPVGYFIKLKNSTNLSRAGEGQSRRMRAAPLLSISELLNFKNGAPNAK